MLELVRGSARGVVQAWIELRATGLVRFLHASFASVVSLVGVTSWLAFVRIKTREHVVVSR